MVLINQSVADSVATLVARHRYGVEDSVDAVRAAEAASAAKNEEIKAAADSRKEELVEKAANATPPDEKRNDWAGKQADTGNEISLGMDDDYEEEQPRPASPPPPPVAAPPPPPPKPAPRRPAPDYDDEDDYSSQSWLR